MTEYLMHYTDFNGLKGILDNNYLRMTDAFRSNDNSELQLGYEYFMKYLKEQNIWKSILEYIEEHYDFSYTWNKHLPNHYRTQSTGGYNMTPSYSCFFTCFCNANNQSKQKKFILENGLLSQWRGYGSQQGYCIIFKKSKIENILRVEHKSRYYDNSRSNDDYEQAREFAKNNEKDPDDLIAALQQIEYQQIKHINPGLSDNIGSEIKYTIDYEQFCEFVENNEKDINKIITKLQRIETEIKDIFKKHYDSNVYKDGPSLEDIENINLTELEDELTAEFRAVDYNEEEFEEAFGYYSDYIEEAIGDKENAMSELWTIQQDLLMKFAGYKNYGFHEENEYRIFNFRSAKDSKYFNDHNNVIKRYKKFGEGKILDAIDSIMVGPSKNKVQNTQMIADYVKQKDLKRNINIFYSGTPYI